MASRGATAAAAWSQHLSRRSCSSTAAPARFFRQLSNCRRRWGACPGRPDGQPFAAAAAGSAGTQPSFEQPSQQQSAQPPFPQAQATLLQAPSSPYELLLEGKRFTCTECGKCCQGSGEVWANDAECAAIARHLGLSPSHFLSRYTKAYSRRPGWRMLKLQAPTGDCVFLEGGKRCTIYAVRPLQCSTYPWWPELMDPAAWVAEGRAICEGIEHEEAPPVDAREKAGVLRAATEHFAEQAAAAEAGRRGKGKKGRR